MMIVLSLYGDPTPQQRPRFFSKNNRVGTYNPQAKIKEGYKWQIRSQYREQQITGPVTIHLTFFMPIPKSTSGIRRRQMINGVIHHIKKPDIDNLQKFVLDCLNNLVISDDSQVIELKSRKVYSEKPGTSILVFAENDMEREATNEDHT